MLLPFACPPCACVSSRCCSILHSIQMHMRLIGNIVCRRECKCKWLLSLCGRGCSPLRLLGIMRAICLDTCCTFICDFSLLFCCIEVVTHPGCNPACSWRKLIQRTAQPCPKLQESWWLMRDSWMNEWIFAKAVWLLTLILMGKSYYFDLLFEMLIFLVLDCNNNNDLATKVL